MRRLLTALKDFIAAGYRLAAHGTTRAQAGVVALIVAASMAITCAHVVPVVKDCGAQAVLGIIDDVNTALATDSWRQGLAALVEKFGLCAVEKAVQEIAGQAEAKGRFDDLEATKAQRARIWLSEQPNVTG